MSGRWKVAEAGMLNEGVKGYSLKFPYSQKHLWLSFLSFFRERPSGGSVSHSRRKWGLESLKPLKRLLVDPDLNILDLWEHALLMWVLLSYAACWSKVLADYPLCAGRNCQRVLVWLHGSMLSSEYSGPGPWHFTEPRLVPGSPSAPLQRAVTAVWQQSYWVPWLPRSGSSKNPIYSPLRCIRGGCWTAGCPFTLLPSILRRAFHPALMGPYAP